MRNFLIRLSGGRGIFGALLVLMIFTSEVGSAGVQILRSDRSGVRILYEPGELKRRQIQTNWGNTEVLEIADCVNTGEPGSPMLPSRSVLVGVPLDAQVTLRVVGTESSQEDGFMVAPAPRLVGEEDGVYEDYTRDDKIYSQDLTLPGKVVALGELGFLRDQRVVEVTFSPVGYNPARGQIIKYQRIVVDLLFSDGEQEDTYSLPREDKAEALYRDLIINYEEARGWRKDLGERRPKTALRGPFAKGQWLKIALREDGIYQIRGEDLEEAGITLAAVDPRTIRMFYGGGEELPRDINTPRRGNLAEIAILVEDDGDGSFDRDDHILFYGNAISRWKYDRERGEFVYLLNHYTKENIYWMTFGDGEGTRMTFREGAPRKSDVVRPLTFRERFHEEAEQLPQAREEVNSGIEWYWEDYSGTSRRYSSLINAPDGADTTLIKIRMIGISDGKHRFSISLNDTPVGRVEFEGSNQNTLVLETPEGPKDGLNFLGVQQLGNSKVRFDWYELEYSRRFEAERGELFFTSPVLSGTAEFRISGLEDRDFKIFEVSDPFSVAQIVGSSYDQDSGAVTFQDTILSETPQQYYLVSRSRWKRPERVWLDENSNLRSSQRGADHLIITHSDFYDQAIDIAEWRSRDNRFGEPLKSEVINVQDIYDEFSWGLFDPTAIRDFIKYAVENWSPTPLFVLLLGDGSFDYKNNRGTSPRNWIPPYEDGNLTYDEWFVRVEGDDSLPDLAIGRLAVQTEEEAKIAVEKIIRYDRDPEMGVWQNTVLLVADDEKRGARKRPIEPVFTWDTEDLSRNYIPETLDQVKLYLTEFDLEGRFKPKAQREFIRLLNRGTILVNYIGHGNWDVLAHEHVFVGSSDMSLLNNERKLPLIFTASCEIGQFDHPVNESLAELMMKYPNGGSIALITAARVAYHHLSMALNRGFYRTFFFSEEPNIPIGIALWKAKLKIPSHSRFVSQRYHLFGDPATVLALPGMGVRLAATDTIRALEKIKVSGDVLSDGQIASDFDGQVMVRVFDSADQVTRVTDLNDIIKYILPGAPIFRGIFPVRGGRFEGLFRVPKDITYGGKLGRISAYVWDGERSGAGELEPLFVGGTASVLVEDETGPTIELGFAGQDFSDGDFVGTSPFLLATIEDESGINVTGEIGHEIVLRVDGDRAFKITEYFISENGYKKGRLRYQIQPLSEGEHTIQLKAWDNFNNSSKKAVKVRVASEGEFSLSNVLCYPNPMSSQTAFTYQLSYPADEVIIKVFSLSGRLIDELEGEGLRGYNQVEWNPREVLSNGVYLYKIMAKSPDGVRAEKIERIVVMR